MSAFRLASSLATAFVITTTAVQAQVGYYRMPTVHNDVVVFVAEGDLWKAPLSGGTATRLTTHLAEETNPSISPDGRTVAYTARYEGPAEVYTIPIDGGMPKQHSWEGIGATVVGWTPDGKVLYTTRRYSTLPNSQLVAVDPRSNTRTLIGLAQASDGSYDRANGTLFFTRLPWQGSHTKRYVGGTAQNIWSWKGDGDGDGEATALKRKGDGGGDGEAQALTKDYPGTSKAPMYWNGRVYFASDRTCARQTATGCEWKPGIMNIWSMKPDGSDVRQHTNHTDYDLQNPSMHNGRIVYQHGADIWSVDLRSTAEVLAKASNDRSSTSPSPSPSPAKLAIQLTTDLEHLRDRWVKNPVQWVSDFHVSPTGDRLALVSRGQMFVAPVETGRFVEVGRASGVRFREAKFSPDGKSIYAFSDASGEVELWRFAANGAGKGEQLTSDAKILRWDFIVSPDGKRIAHWDKNNELFVYDVDAKRNTRIAQGRYDGQGDIRWSPDSKWLAYVEAGANQLSRVHMYSIADGKTTPVTSDRYDSYAPTFSSDGAWLYYLSDRTFNSSVGSPWGSRQPEPYYNNQTRIMAIALDPASKWLFAPATELDSARASDSKAASTVSLAGVLQRQYELPVPAGNYNALNTDGKRLYYFSRDDRNTGGNVKLNTLELTRDAKPEVFIENVGSYEISADNKKVLLRRGNDFFVVNAGAKAPAAAALNDNKVDLSGWQFALDRKEELQSLFVDAWRLERDYFYDPGMHGVDWPAMRRKYEPLAARVTDRSELNDVVAQMVGELSALHIFVRGGDLRAGQDTIVPASLGAVLEQDESRGGWRVAKIYKSDPDIPAELAPLARPDVRVSEGDIIVAIDHIPTLSVEHPAQLLAGKAGRQVLLTVRGVGAGAGVGAAGAREVVAYPITMARENDLRYDEWEYTRRLAVDSLSKGRVGYVHLRAMGGGNMAEFTREYYPVFNREALIVDVRHNNGGNIDAWLLNRLMRKAWFYWQPRVAEPTWNQHFAFRGPMVTLINENSASDGEAFPEGFRRLGLGKLIGTRTWGGEIWLSQNNFLADRGIATAAETGVYGPEGEWLIEGWGVEPDVVVDNLPRATFLGRDAQLEAAVRAMVAEVDARPNPVPRAPRYPRK